jgi:hypothetical protein
MGSRFLLVAAGSDRGLFLGAAVAFPDKLVEFFFLLGDAIRDPLFVLAAGGGRRLLDQLPKIVSDNRDAILEFR